MQVNSVELRDFKKHKHVIVNFQSGSNLITGSNYVGKSSLMQAILVGLFGNSMSPGTTKDLVRHGARDFTITLTLSSGLVVTRTTRDSSVARGSSEPFARGHTAVNAAIADELSMDKNTFTKVFASSQGSPQQLLQMEGAELQRFIENCIGVEKLDVVAKFANSGATHHKNLADMYAEKVLGSDDLTHLCARKVGLETVIGEEATHRVACEASLAQAVQQVNETTQRIKFAQGSNAARDVYEQKSARAAKLNYIPRRGTTECFNEVAALQEQVQAQRTRQTLQDKLGYLQAQIAGKTRLVEPVCDRSVETRISEMVAERTGVENNMRARAVIKTRLDKLVAEFENTDEHIDVSWADPAPYRANEETDKRLLNNHRQLRDNLASLLKDNLCPTCLRPKNDSASEVDSLTEKLKDAEERLLLLQKNLTVSGWAYEQVLRNNKVAEDAAQRIQGFVERIRICKEQLDELPQPPDCMGESIERLQEHLVKERETNRQTLELAAKIAQDNRTLDILEPELFAVTESLAEIPEEDLGSLQASLLVAQRTLQEIMQENSAAKINNELLDILKQEISRLEEAGVMEWVDIEALFAELVDLQRSVGSLNAIIRQSVEKEGEARRELTTTEAALDDHHKAFETFTANGKRAAQYKSVHNTLMEFRVKLISGAYSTILSVASEFARVCTEGDMQEVLLRGGDIAYKEGDIIHTKHRASGAQKTIIGLGLKLGLLRLVKTDFDCLLLDEVSADMDPEISVRSLLALGYFCKQLIVVTHRSMDIAGNVVEL